MLQAQIYFDKDEMVGSKSQEEYIMQFLIRHKMIGATVIRGMSGFGPNQLLKRPDALFSFDEVPMIITFIDEEEKVKKVLTKLKPLVKNCLIFTSHVDKW